MFKTLVVVPTYCEAENIQPLLLTVSEACPEAHVLVVDDNSPDGTAELVRKASQRYENLHLLSREKEGLGAAYVAGFRWGLERHYDVLIEMDADLSHNPHDLPRFLKTLETCDAAVGCRYIAGGGIEGWSWIRQGISRGGNIYARTLLRLPYRDLTGGYNAWKREVLEKIDLNLLSSRGYGFQVELKWRAHQAGFHIQEIPIHFCDRERGQSKMSSHIVFEAARKVLSLRRELSA